MVRILGMVHIRECVLRECKIYTLPISFFLSIRAFFPIECKIYTLGGFYLFFFALCYIGFTFLQKKEFVLQLLMPFQGLIFRMKKLFQYSAVVFLIFGYSLQAQEEFDPYKILGVSNTADIHQINQAYRQQLHELYVSEDPSLEKLERISLSFGVLGDPGLRMQYDQGRLDLLDADTVNIINQRMVDRLSETVRDFESGIFEERSTQTETPKTEDSKSSFEDKIEIIPLKGKIGAVTEDGKIENMEGRFWHLFEVETENTYRDARFRLTVQKPFGELLLFENSKAEFFILEGRNLIQVFDPPQSARDIGHWLEEKWRNRQSTSTTPQDSTIPPSKALIPAESTEHIRIESKTIVQELLENKVRMLFGKIQSMEITKTLSDYEWKTQKVLYDQEKPEFLLLDYRYGKIVQWTKKAPNTETPLIELEIQRDNDTQRLFVNKTTTDQNGDQRVERITQYQDPFIKPDGNVVEGRVSVTNSSGQVQEMVRQRSAYPNPLAERKTTSSIEKLRTMIQNFPGKLSRMYQSYRRSSSPQESSSSASAEEWVTVEEDRTMSEEERAERERVSPRFFHENNRAENLAFWTSVFNPQNNVQTTENKEKKGPLGRINSALSNMVRPDTSGKPLSMIKHAHTKFPLETIAFYTSIGALMYLTASNSPNPINTLLEQTTSSVGLTSFYMFVLASGITNVGLTSLGKRHNRRTNDRLHNARSRLSPDDAEMLERKHERFVKRLRFWSTPLSLTAGMYASTFTSEFMMDPDRKACQEGIENPGPGRGYNVVDSCQIHYNNWVALRPHKFFQLLPDLYSLILSSVIANQGIIPIVKGVSRLLWNSKWRQRQAWSKWFKKEITNIADEGLEKLPGKAAGGPWKAFSKLVEWIPATFVGVWGSELVKSIGRFLPFLGVIEILHPWTVNIKKYGLFRNIADQKQKVKNDFESMLNWDDIPKEECIFKEDPRTIAKKALYQYYRQGVDEWGEGMRPFIQNLFLENVDCPERDVRDGLDYYSNKMKELRSVYLASFFEEVQLWMNRIQETLLSYQMSKDLAFNLYEYKKAEHKHLAELVDKVDLSKIPLPDRLSQGTYSIGRIEAFRNIVNRLHIETLAHPSVAENQETEEAVPAEENQNPDFQAILLALIKQDLTEDQEKEKEKTLAEMIIDQAYPFYGIGADRVHDFTVLRYGIRESLRSLEYNLENIQPYLDSAVAYLEGRGVPTADHQMVSQAVSQHFPYEYFNPHYSVPNGQTLSLIKTLLSCKNGVSDCIKHISAGVDLLVQTISKESKKTGRNQNKVKLYYAHNVRNLLSCGRTQNCSYADMLKAYPVGLFWFETQKKTIQETILGHREQTREDSFFPSWFDSFEEDYVERIFYQMACGNDLKDYEPDMDLKIREISEDHIEELPLYTENDWGVENYTFNMPRLTKETAPICDNTDYNTAFHQSFYWRGRYYANLLHYIKNHIGTNEQWWKEKVEYQHIVVSQYEAKIYKDVVVREHYIPAMTTEEQVQLLEVSDSIKNIETANLYPSGQLFFENVGKPLMVGLAETGEHFFDAGVSSVDGITGVGSYVWDEMLEATLPSPILENYRALVSLEESQLKQLKEDLKKIENSQIDENTRPGIRTMSKGLLQNFRDQAEFLFDMLKTAHKDVLNEKVSIMRGWECSQYIDSFVLADIGIKTHCEEDLKRYQEETGNVDETIQTHKLKDGLIITKKDLIQLAREHTAQLIDDLITYNREKLLEVEPSLLGGLLKARKKEKDKINEEFQGRFSDIRVLLRPLVFQQEIVEDQDIDVTENSLRFLANNFESIIQHVQYNHIYEEKFDDVRENIMSDSGTLKDSTILVYEDFEKFKALIWLIEILNAEEWESLYEKLQPFMNQDSRQTELQLKVLRKISGQTTLEELKTYFKEIESIYTQHPQEVEQFRLALSEFFQCTSTAENKVRQTRGIKRQQTPKEINDGISELFGSHCHDLNKLESLRIALKSLPTEKDSFRTAVESLYVFRDNPHLLYDFLTEMTHEPFLSETQKEQELSEIKAMREQIPLIREWLNQDNLEDVGKYLKFALILKGGVSTDTYLTMSLKKVLKQIQEKNFDQLRLLIRDIDLAQVFIEHPPLLEIAFIRDPNLLKNLNSQQLLNHFKPQLNAIHSTLDIPFGNNLEKLVDICFAFDDINQSEGYKGTANVCNRTLFKARDQVVITVMQSLHSLITELVQLNTQVDLIKTILSDTEEKEEQTIGDLSGLENGVDYYLVRERMQAIEEEQSSEEEATPQEEKEEQTTEDFYNIGHGIYYQVITDKDQMKIEESKYFISESEMQTAKEQSSEEEATSQEEKEEQTTEAEQSSEEESNPQENTTAP